MSKVTPLNTDKAPAAIGPYSQATTANGLVFVSGQLPINPAVGKIEASNVADQTRQCLENLQHILASDGLTLADALKTTVYLANIQDFAAMNEVYAEYFQAPYPARAAFEVAALPQGALVEIELVAAK